MGVDAGLGVGNFWFGHSCLARAGGRDFGLGSQYVCIRSSNVGFGTRQNWLNTQVPCYVEERQCSPSHRQDIALCYRSRNLVHRVLSIGRHRGSWVVEPSLGKGWVTVGYRVER